jgi:CPA1 family monovalent cation:H+ antiporter
VAELLRDLVDRRTAIVETALEAMQLQYPGYSDEVQRRFIQRTALRFEEREYEAMFDDGLIGAELLAVLRQDIVARREAAERRPPLDVKPSRAELVRQVPLFADLDAPTLKRLARSLKTRHANAGEILLERKNATDSVYFIASGAVELEVAGQTWRLGRGKIFGELEILSRQRRRATVRAIAPTTLLVLDEARFRRLLNKSAALQKAVEASARARGLDPRPFLRGTPSVSGQT